jgi:hypothetical protein
VDDLEHDQDGRRDHDAAGDHQDPLEKNHR